MLEDIKQITYRGHLKSCNYTCHYCPFSKNKISKVELEGDKVALDRFMMKLGDINFENSLEVLFTPYGEALIHDYYLEAFRELSNREYISKIGCQTNLSFDVDKFLSRDIDFSKVYLWATFHPTMVGIEEFVSKVTKLHSKISISVGIVGNTDELHIFKVLRQKLPSNVYMWVNAMDGLGRKYTEFELEFFTEHDPVFTYEVGRLDSYKCSGGSSHIFVKGNGEIFSCNRNKKSLGNIYKSSNLEEAKCSGGCCDCYLAYSHTHEFLENKFIRENNLFRVPNKVKPKAIFFDIDGTLTEDRLTLEKAFKYLASKTQIYIATERPEKIAFRNIGFLKKYVSGGVFSGGSYIVDYKNGFKHVEEIKNIDTSFLETVYSDKKSTVYEEENCIYRVITHKNFASSKLGDVDIIQQSNRMYSLVSCGVDKFFGIKILCNEVGLDIKDVMAVGNETNDIVMFENCGYSVAVLNSSDEVKASAEYCLNVTHIALMI